MESEDKTEKIDEQPPIFDKAKTIESRKTWTLFGFIPIWSVSVTLEGEEDLYERVSDRVFRELNTKMLELYNVKRS